MCEEVNINATNISLLIKDEGNNSMCPMATADDLTILTLLSFLLEGVLQFIISGLGILGNTASIFLLTRKELSSFFNQLLVVLVMYDLIYLLSMMLGSLIKLGLESDIHTILFPYVLYPLNAISMMGSIYMTMAVGMERYIAVYYPVEYSIVANDASSHNRRLAKYVLPITIFSVLFNLPKFLESQVLYRDQEVFMEVTDLRMSTTYVTWYHNWARFLILGIIPFTVICFLNFKIYLAVNKRRKTRGKRQDDNLSVVLMMIIASFVFCNTLRILLNMHEITVIEEIHPCRCSNLGGFPVWILILGFLSPILLVINSSVNLLIYCVFGTKFRQVLCSYLPCCGARAEQPVQGMANPNLRGTNRKVKGKLKLFLIKR